ncbi:MAG: hypothetical protein Q7T82_05815 [Armatimonadota bacterium]|nr:hypothetical protein [Armatimonadota bacterium]
MKLDKADMPKVIALGALIAVVLGYGLYSLVGKKASAAPSPPSVREAAEKSPAAAPPVVKTKPKPAEQATQVAMLTTAAPPRTKDPFAPCMSAEQTMCSPPPPMLPRSAALRSLPPFRPGNPMGFGIRPIGSAPLMGSPIPEADPQFLLTGIINGSVNVAIIRAGDSGRYIVREGQIIDGRYFVKFIGRDRVVLTRGTRSIDLKLGGGTNAS